MSALALVGMAIHPNEDGSVTVGAATMPAWMASDVAVRIAEAAGSVPGAVARRRAVRLFLDRLFLGAHLVRVRDLRSGAYSLAPAYREGQRAHVRLGDSASAWCRRDGKRARGMLVEWHHDAIHGFVCTAVEDFGRVSVAWAAVDRMADRLAVEDAPVRALQVGGAA